MSWPFSQRVGQLGATAQTLLGERTAARVGSNEPVSRDSALRASAVWACLRLRADLISTMPVDVFRRIEGVQVEQTKPPVLVTPGGKRVRWVEWAYSTQWDLDSIGNTVGVITLRDGFGLPAEIQLANMDEVTFIGKGSTLERIRIGSKEYTPDQVWHEKQFTVSGVPIGLSPIAYAAMTLNAGLSAQQFTVDWFSNSTMPGGHLKNTAKVLKREEAQNVKSSFKASVEAGDVWVSGNDWEYNMLAAKASESQFLETQKSSVVDICRYLGVPGDMIDAESSTGSITYANITQRNLQLLIMNLGPAIVRREDAISAGICSQARYVKLNTAALLRMDTKTRLEGHKVAIDSRIYPPSRALDMENMAPLTAEEKAEFAELFPVKATAPTAPPIEKAAATHIHLQQPDQRHQHVTNVTNQMPEQAAPEIHHHVKIEPAEVRAPDVNVNVEGTTVEVEPTPLEVRVASPDVPIEVHVEPTPVEITNQAPDVNVTVQPADPQVVVQHPSSSEVKRDGTGNITGTVYKYDEEP